MLGLSLFSSGGLPGTHWCPINLPKHTSFYLLFCLSFWWAQHPDNSVSFDPSDLDNFKSQTVRSAVNVREGQGVVLLCGPPVNSGGEREIHTCQSLVFFLHLHAYLWIHKESFPSTFSFSVEGQCDLACPFVPWLMMLNNFFLQKSPQRLSVTATISSLSRKSIMGLRSVLICSCANHYIYTT